MQAIPIVEKKIGTSHLVWVKNSHTFLQLEEPYWFVFKKLANRRTEAAVIRSTEKHYGWSPEECRTFVADIALKLHELNQPTSSVHPQLSPPKIVNDYTFTPFTIHHYQFGNKAITFSFDSPLVEHYIHPLVSHLEVEEGLINSSLFELFHWNGKVVFRMNGEAKGIYTPEETHLLKGLIFTCMINIIHGKTESDWLMTIHASAITNGKKCILFCAPPGHGKTTLAALLQTLGFRLISDDFVPIDRNQFSTYPFPIAMSVKEGSVKLLSNYFPSLTDKAVTIMETQKQVRYLEGFLPLEQTNRCFPVREIVFVQYDPAIEFQMEKLETTKATQKIFEQSWVTPLPGNAEILFNQLEQLSFYQLSYSDNEKAIEAITQLFHHDQ